MACQFMKKYKVYIIVLAFDRGLWYGGSIAMHFVNNNGINRRMDTTF